MINPSSIDWISTAWYIGMAFFGGVIDHILSFEKAKQEWTYAKHFWYLVMSWMKSFFLMALVYSGGQAYMNWPAPVCWFLTGIFAAFSSDTIRWISDGVRKVIGAKLPKGPGDE